MEETADVAAAKPTAVASAPVVKTQAPASAPAAKASSAPAAKAASTRADASRVARAQATKSARAAHLINAANYGYVLHDLRLTGALAVIMLIVMIVLKFILK